MFSDTARQVRWLPVVGDARQQLVQTERHCAELCRLQDSTTHHHHHVSTQLPTESDLYVLNKSVFSFLRQLSTSNCSHLLLSAVQQRRCCWAPSGRRCRSISPACTALSRKLAALGCRQMTGQTNGQRDGRMTVS